MLSLRNLHRSSENKTRQKGLTVDKIARVYSLDGFKRLPNETDEKNFLLQMEPVDRFLTRKLGSSFITLKTCKFTKRNACYFIRRNFRE